MATQGKRANAKVQAIRPEQQLMPTAGLVAATVIAFDEHTGEVTLRLGRATAPAHLDPTVDRRVLVTALARGERVIAQHDAGTWLIVGALRTSPTPGVDDGDEFVIRARRIFVKADHEFSVVSGTASFVLRAQGFVETLAQDITTRASSVHKIIGRLIRLN
jgi:hypothetical protein